MPGGLPFRRRGTSREAQGRRGRRKREGGAQPLLPLRLSSHHHAEVLEDECNKDTYQCRAWCNHHRARKCTRTRGIMRWARVFLVPWLTVESYFYSLHSEQARVVMPCTWNREAARGCQADGII